MVNEEFLLEYLDRINAQIQKVRRTVQAIQEGDPFTEAFDEKLFTEGKHDREISAALRQTTRVMHHLLKFRLSTSECPLRNWYDSIRDAREKLIEATDWYLDSQKDTYCTNVKLGLKYITNKCSWSLRDLIRTSYPKLLAMIPAVDKADEIHFEKRMDCIVELDYKD